MERGRVLMLNLTWTDTGLEDLSWWTENNPKILKRIISNQPEVFVYKDFRSFGNFGSLIRKIYERLLNILL